MTDVERDQFGQYAKPVNEFTDWEWDLFSVLEDMCGPNDGDRTITEYMADVLDLIEQRELQSVKLRVGVQAEHDAHIPDVVQSVQNALDAFEGEWIPNSVAVEVAE